VGEHTRRHSVTTHVTAHALLVLHIVCAFPVFLYQRYDRWAMPNTPNCRDVKTGLYTELRGARDLHFWATEFKSYKR